ncbi:hypothetical protein CL622_02485 [archaeon]|nr:hypothetical protein [archaeon]
MVDEDKDLDIMGDDELNALQSKAEKAEELAKRVLNSTQTINQQTNILGQPIGQQQQEAGKGGALPYGMGSGGSPIGSAEGKMVGFKQGQQIGGGVRRMRDNGGRAPYSKERWSEMMEARLAELELAQQADQENLENQQGHNEQQEEREEETKRELERINEKFKNIKSQTGKLEELTSKGKQMFGGGGAGLPGMMGKGIQGKMLGMISKFGGPYGMIIAFLIDFIIRYVTEMVKWIIEEVKAMYAPGGIYDIRKQVKDEAKQYQDLQNLINIKHGEVYFSSYSNEVVRQGTPVGTTNMADLSLGMKRYVETHDTDPV